MACCFAQPLHQWPVQSVLLGDQTLSLDCRRTLELEAANFVEELHCVAVHPAAGLLLVGFQDKLRLYTVLEDELK
jgi:hypothetical protein